MKIDNYRGDVNFKYILCPSRLSGTLYVSEIGKRRWRKAKEAFPVYRDYYTIHFLRSGDGRFCGKPFAANQGFVSFPNEKCWYERGEDWHVYWVKFGGIEAASFLRGIGLTTSRVLDFEHCPTLIERLDSFLESPERAERATEVDFLEILFGVLSSVRVPEGVIERTSDYVKSARSYIEENSTWIFPSPPLRRTCTYPKSICGGSSRRKWGSPQSAILLRAVSAARRRCGGIFPTLRSAK